MMIFRTEQLEKIWRERKVGRGDWRRENVNTFVRSVYSSIKAAKPWVKFGIAPSDLASG